MRLTWILLAIPLVCGCGQIDESPAAIAAPITLDEPCDITMEQAYYGALVILHEQYDLEEGETLEIRDADILVMKMCQLQLDVIPLPDDWEKGATIKAVIWGVVPPEFRRTNIGDTVLMDRDALG